MVERSKIGGDLALSEAVSSATIPARLVPGTTETQPRQFSFQRFKTGDFIFTDISQK